MKKPILNAVFTLIFLLILLGVILFFWQPNEVQEINKESYNQKITRPSSIVSINHGIYTNIWFRNQEKLDRFIENDIKYLFIDVGDIEKSGKLKTSDKEIMEFIDFIEFYEEENNFDFILLPYNEIILHDYDFSKETFRKNVIENHANLIKLGFDGAHIDIEAIPHNQRNLFLEFLEEIGGEIGKDKLLTIYSGAIDETPNVWEWKIEFFNAVSNKVDIIAIQSYDFNLVTKEAYQNYLEEQLDQIMSQSWNAKILFTPPTHKNYPENLQNALEIYKNKIEKNSNNQFIGVGIFAEWTTDESEWKVFEYFKHSLN